MFCPECRDEHPPAATVCRACGETLVRELAPEEPDAGAAPEVVWTDTVAVLRSTDLAEVLVAKSVLQAHGIAFEVRGELLQDLLAPRFLGGFNPLTGPMEIRVPAGSEADAREVLTHAVDLREPESEGDGED